MSIESSIRTSREISVDPLEIYLKDINQGELLTAQEELDLAKTYGKGRRAQEKLKTCEGGRSKKRLEKIVAEGQEAKTKLIERNLRLVVSIAQKHGRKGLPLLDLIQEGNFGLFRAVDKFDFKRGYRFSTYAYRWIEQFINRTLANDSRNIRIPVHVVEKFGRIDRISADVAQEFGREATPEEMALAMNTTVARIREIDRARQESVSLEKPVRSKDGDDRAAKLEDIIKAPDDSAVEAVESVAESELLKILKDNLSEREYQVLLMRFSEQKPLQEIAGAIGISRERARQIEIKALGKLRTPRIQNRLKKFISDEPLKIIRENYS
ncbi:sigma-70 family RNA polymerase sigma factor [Candidatus Daviesbacteria bacterium]|nr:sigma-70 family RNA polymerase sigma factor [Candidatus Daviesbacteria bacterium]